MLGEDEDIDDEGAFHKKGVWARFSVIFAGAFFNFILAFVLALVVISVVGVDYPKVLNVQEDFAVYEAGLREGDLIKKINGKRIHFGKEIDLYFFLNPSRGLPIDITYERDNKTYEATIYPKLLAPFYKLGIEYSGQTEKATILAIEPGLPFYDAGILPGDVITSINGTSIETGQDMKDYFEANPLSEAPLDITYLRGKEVRTAKVTPKLVTDSYSLGLYYNTYREKVTPLEAFKNSFFELKYNINYTLSTLKYLLSGKASINEVSGPVGIVTIVDNIVDQTVDEGAGIVFLNLASFTTMLSANLGVINLLPFPALDGGRLVFLIIEAIRRKPIPKEKEAMVHFVGLALLMLLMVVVIFNDFRKIFG